MFNLFHGSIHPQSGLIVQASNQSVDETINKIETLLKLKSMKVFARVNYVQEVETMKFEMRPTELKNFRCLF